MWKDPQWFPMPHNANPSGIDRGSESMMKATVNSCGANISPSADICALCAGPTQPEETFSITPFQVVLLDSVPGEREKKRQTPGGGRLFFSF